MDRDADYVLSGFTQGFDWVYGGILFGTRVFSNYPATMVAKDSVNAPFLLEWRGRSPLCWALGGSSGTGWFSILAIFMSSLWVLSQNLTNLR